MSRKIDGDKNTVRMSKFVHIQIWQENTGQLFFKTSFDGEFAQMNYVSCRRGHELNCPEDVQLVTKQKLSINRKKYNDLMALLPLPLLPTVCQYFFKNLPNVNDAPMYPVDDSEEDSN